MEALILVLFLLIMILLGLEAYQVKRDRALLQHVVYGHKLILLINNRADRGYRAIHMAMVAHELQPEEVWITGGARGAVCREIKKRLPGTPVYSLGSEKEVPLDRTGSDTVIFAAGNLAGPGRSLIERVVGEGKRIVP